MPVDKFCPHDEACSKHFRTDAAGMTVAPGPIVEHFNVIEDCISNDYIIPVWYGYY